MQTLSSVPWQHDFDSALQQAQTDRKFVLLDIFNPG